MIYTQFRIFALVSQYIKMTDAKKIKPLLSKAKGIVLNLKSRTRLSLVMLMEVFALYSIENKTLIV